MASSTDDDREALADAIMGALEARLEPLRAELRANFAEVGGKLTAMETRLTAMETRLTARLEGVATHVVDVRDATVPLTHVEKVRGSRWCSPCGAVVLARAHLTCCDGQAAVTEALRKRARARTALLFLRPGTVSAGEWVATDLRPFMSQLDSTAVAILLRRLNAARESVSLLRAFSRRHVSAERGRVSAALEQALGPVHSEGPGGQAQDKLAPLLGAPMPSAVDKVPQWASPATATMFTAERTVAQTVFDAQTESDVHRTWACVVVRAAGSWFRCGAVAHVSPWRWVTGS